VSVVTHVTSQSKTMESVGSMVLATVRASATSARASALASQRVSMISVMADRDNREAVKTTVGQSTIFLLYVVVGALIITNIGLPTPADFMFITVGVLLNSVFFATHTGGGMSMSQYECDITAALAAAIGDESVFFNYKVYPNAARSISWFDALI